MKMAFWNRRSFYTRKLLGYWWVGVDKQPHQLEQQRSHWNTQDQNTDLGQVRHIVLYSTKPGRYWPKRHQLSADHKGNLMNHTWAKWWAVTRPFFTHTALRQPIHVQLHPFPLTTSLTSTIWPLSSRARVIRILAISIYPQRKLWTKKCSLIMISL